MANKITVVLVDDHDLVREGTRLDVAHVHGDSLCVGV